MIRVKIDITSALGGADSAVSQTDDNSPVTTLAEITDVFIDCLEKMGYSPVRLKKYVKDSEYSGGAYVDEKSDSDTE